jgi:hypothetical protein
MNRMVLGASALVVVGLLSPAVARAQTTPEGGVVEGAGYPIGEGTVVHPTLGGEVGFTDNVFYGDQAFSRYAAGILRLVAEAAIASKEIQPEEQPDEFLDPNEEAPAEPAHQKVTYRLGGKLSYQEDISPKYFVRDQRDLAVDLGANAVIAPQGTVAFGVDEHFLRDTRPENFQSSFGTDRDANTLALDLKYQPGGHTLNAGLRWENQLDFFERSDLRFANRMENFLHARSEWEFFPYSKVFADFSYGFISPLSSAMYKHSAQPIRGGIGLATAITEVLTIKAHVGWAYAAYAGGASYNSPLLGAEVGYRYSPLGRVVLGYDWDHYDSVNSDFYQDHALTLRVDQGFGKIVADAHGDVRFRSYRGVPMSLGGGPNRDDLLFTVGADASYVMKDWLAIVLNYRTELDTTSYRYDAGIFGSDDPGYVRTEITAGVRAAL